MFSKACEYAIRAVVFLHGQSARGRKIPCPEISREIGAPAHFMAKILQSLSSQRVVCSVKGPNGGFFLNAEQENQPLKNVVAAIDGDSIFSGCGLGLPSCSASNPCAMHHQFAEIRDRLHLMLITTTIGDLSGQVMEGLATLKRT